MHALAAWSTSPRSWCKALVEGVLRRESLACCTALHVSQEGVTLDEGCGWQYSVPYQGTRGVKFASRGIW